MKTECLGHVNSKAWLRGPVDKRGYHKIICGGCEKFIGWERPQNKKVAQSSKAELANREMYQGTVR